MASQTTVAEAGRKGGLSRARQISPERRRAIGRKSAGGRWAKKYLGISKAEFIKRYSARLRENDPNLAYWMTAALKAPSEDVCKALIDYLSDETFEVIERAAYEVLAEVALAGLPTGVKAQ
jgi:Flavinator of succinate dehydrogenase